MYTRIYRKNLLIPFIKICLDALAIEGAVIFSFYLRFFSPLTALFPVTKGFPPFFNYFWAGVVLLIIYLTLFSNFYSYRSRYFSSFNQDIPIVIKTSFIGTVFSMSGAFLYRGFSFSRLTFLLVFINTIVFLLFDRFFFHRIKKYFMNLGYGVINFVVIGSPSQLKRFFFQFNRAGSNHIRICGYYCENKISGCMYPYLGNWESLSTTLQNLQYDGLLLSFEGTEHEKIINIIHLVEGKNIELFYIPDLLDLYMTSTPSIEIGGLPVLQLKSVAFSGWQGFLKRTFDLCFSILGLLFFSPAMVIFSVLIKVTSPGPVLHRQRRVGLDGKEFTMLKFRSMKLDAEKETGPVWTVKNDPRTTKIGRLLRRLSLDELPQLLNVLKGEMSIVGPRPERKIFVEQFKQQIPKYAERHRVRSGMTGWAQVNGLRGQSSITDRTRYDVYYIENWSLWFDLKVILLTFAAIIRGEHAY
jgi:exopolysaccharide biosynthesis polyprenyl glycosylphosphotransferase